MIFDNEGDPSSSLSDFSLQFSVSNTTALPEKSTDQE
jgi:hypothetical protein